jgi:GNAT superfamily N-acetyltransferase
MQHAIQIRPAAAADSPAISPLLEQLGYRMPLDALAEKLSANTAGRFAFVAEIDGRIAGFMTLHVIDWFHRSDAAARLSAVAVDAAYRRMGVGRALVAFAETTASQIGCSYIELTSSLRRKPGGTYAFYDSLGYRSAQDETTYFRKALR